MFNVRRNYPRPPPPLAPTPSFDGGLDHERNPSWTSVAEVEDTTMQGRNDSRGGSEGAGGRLAAGAARDAQAVYEEGEWRFAVSSGGGGGGSKRKAAARPASPETMPNPPETHTAKRIRLAAEAADPNAAFMNQPVTHTFFSV